MIAWPSPPNMREVISVNPMPKNESLQLADYEKGLYLPGRAFLPSGRKTAGRHASGRNAVESIKVHVLYKETRRAHPRHKTR